MGLPTDRDKSSNFLTITKQASTLQTTSEPLVATETTQLSVQISTLSDDEYYNPQSSQPFSLILGIIHSTTNMVKTTPIPLLTSLPTITVSSPEEAIVHSTNPPLGIQETTQAKATYLLHYTTRAYRNYKIVEGKR